MPDRADRDSRAAHPARELILTALCLVVTVVVTLAVQAIVVRSIVREIRSGAVTAVVRTAAFGTALSALAYGNVVYHLARWGRYRRAHRSSAVRRLDAGREEACFGPGADPGLLTVLIPSYREDPAVVRQTVLSAALQDYPDRRVVVLIDDPPDPADEDARRSLDAVRRLPIDLDRTLDEPRRRISTTAARCADLLSEGTTLSPVGLRAHAEQVGVLFERAAAWLEQQAAREQTDDHAGRLFVQLTYEQRAAACRAHARHTQALADDEALSSAHLRAGYARLAAMFRVEVTTFERKRFANLSHEPNKAMNLNAYIGLLGARWRSAEHADGSHLVRDDGSGPSRLDVPDSRWLLTVDADSVLTHDYAVRLVTQMQRDEHARTAVMQTPYVAVPGARRPIERIAGATTDIMHLVHQGSTHFRATFWVGANALLRVAALGDIASPEWEGGRRVVRYIQDRTVIEDTESTIDLVDAGWRLYNYPEQLAYSATPADYGSLLIQRRRWANGGLIILPKLLRSYLATGLRGRLGEATLRVHYLVSTSTVTAALLMLMTLPFSPDVPVWLLVATCVPYFELYARDLRLVGRRRRDLLGVYALNLLLIPVQLGGVLKSVQQAITKQRIPFGRTPKVRDRTAAPALYVAMTLALLAWWSGGTVADLMAGRHAHAIMSGVNAVALGAAVTRYVGWRAAAADLTAPLRARARTGAVRRSEDGTCRSPVPRRGDSWAEEDDAVREPAAAS